MNRTIAVLAVQGAFIEHQRRLESLGCTVVQLRQEADLDQPFDGLVLPGGESTVQAKLLHELGLFDPLRQHIVGGLPTLGTCAGLILLAEHVEGTGDLAGRDEALASERTAVDGFHTLPVTVQRNAYGRQLGSFQAEAPLVAALATGPITEPGTTPVPLTFIRAPRIEAVGADVEVLVSYGEYPVAVRYNKQLGTAFHPELTSDNRIYELFLSL